MATRSSESMKRLKARGHRGVAVVEKYVSFCDADEDKPRTGQRARFRGGYRKDLWGFADIICFRLTGPGIIAVQCTSKQQESAHLRKFRRDADTRQNILDCLACGNRVVIHGWDQPGGPKTRWVLHEREITIADMALTAADEGAIAASEPATPDSVHAKTKELFS